MGKVKIPKPDRPPSGDRDRVRESDFWPGKPAPLPGTVSLNPPYKHGELVCVYCGRRGTRGFVISSGNGEGTKDTYRCASLIACESRA